MVPLLELHPATFRAHAVITRITKPYLTRATDSKALISAPGEA